MPNRKITNIEFKYKSQADSGGGGAPDARPLFFGISTCTPILYKRANFGLDAFYAGSKYRLLSLGELIALSRPSITVRRVPQLGTSNPLQL